MADATRITEESVVLVLTPAEAGALWRLSMDIDSTVDDAMAERRVTTTDLSDVRLRNLVHTDIYSTINRIAGALRSQRRIGDQL